MERNQTQFSNNAIPTSDEAVDDLISHLTSINTNEIQHPSSNVHNSTLNLQDDTFSGNDDDFSHEYDSEPYQPYNVDPYDEWNWENSEDSNLDPRVALIVDLDRRLEEDALEPLEDLMTELLAKIRAEPSKSKLAIFKSHVNEHHALGGIVKLPMVPVHHIILNTFSARLAEVFTNCVTKFLSKVGFLFTNPFEWRSALSHELFPESCDSVAEFIRQGSTKERKKLLKDRNDQLFATNYEIASQVYNMDQSSLYADEVSLPVVRRFKENARGELLAVVSSGIFCVEENVEYTCGIAVSIPITEEEMKVLTTGIFQQPLKVIINH